VLSEQLSELKTEIDRIEAGFAVEFVLHIERRINPRESGQLLEHKRRALRAALAQQKRDILMLSDVATTKRWLKRQRQLMREAEFDFEMF
jgi:hypothetical protein